jgi:hypothetical protein
MLVPDWVAPFQRTQYEATGDDKGVWPKNIEIETKWLPAVWMHLPAS